MMASCSCQSNRQISIDLNCLLGNVSKRPCINYRVWPLGQENSTCSCDECKFQKIFLGGQSCPTAVHRIFNYSKQIPKLMTHSKLIVTVFACTMPALAEENQLQLGKPQYTKAMSRFFSSSWMGILRVLFLNLEGRERSYVWVGWSEIMMKEFRWTRSTVGTDATMRQAATARSKGKSVSARSFGSLSFYLSPLLSSTFSTQDDEGSLPSPWPSSSL